MFCDDFQHRSKRKEKNTCFSHLKYFFDWNYVKSFLVCSCSLFVVWSSWWFFFLFFAFYALEICNLDWQRMWLNISQFLLGKLCALLPGISYWTTSYLIKLPPKLLLSFLVVMRLTAFWVGKSSGVQSLFVGLLWPGRCRDLTHNRLLLGSLVKQWAVCSLWHLVVRHCIWNGSRASNFVLNL